MLFLILLWFSHFYTSCDNFEISIDRFKSNYINDKNDFTKCDELKDLQLYANMKILFKNNQNVNVIYIEK